MISAASFPECTVKATIVPGKGHETVGQNPRLGLFSASLVGLCMISTIDADGS